MSNESPKPILGSRICQHSKECAEDKPCDRCLYIGRTEKAVFTPAQEKEIDEFIKKHSDLMDDLAKIEDLEKVVLENLANFGTPEKLGCGVCGKWVNSVEEFVEHVKEHANS